MSIVRRIRSSLIIPLPVVHHNPSPQRPPLNRVEAEVFSYLSKYPQTQDATTALLELIHQLVDSESICQTRQLPKTARSMWKHFQKPDLSQAGIEIDTLSAADGAIEEPFPHLTLAGVISEMLEDNFVREALLLDTELPPVRHRDVRAPVEERSYGELHTAEWWHSTRICFAQKFGNVQGRHALLGVILYVDGIAVDFFGKVGLMPIMLTIGNLPRKARESTQGKRLLGFIPSLSKVEIKQRTKKDPGMVKRDLMHQAMNMYVTSSSAAQV